MPARKRGRKKKTTSTKQVYKNKKEIKRLNQLIEMKFCDGQATQTNVYTTLQGLGLNLDIAKGDDRHKQRIGRSLRAKKIFIRGYINNNNGTPTDDIVRVILVRHKTCNGNAIAVGDLLYNMNAASYAINSNRNVNHMSDFKVYLDTTFAVDTTGHSLIPFKIIQKLDHEVVYNESADTGAIGTMEENCLYLLFLGTKPTDATNNPSVIYEWRYSYKDA